MGLNRDLIKKAYSGGDPFPISAEAGVAYADATNSKNPRYRGPDAIAPPMLGVAFTFGALGAPLIDPGLHADLMRLVHGDQDMRFLRPVRAGDVITATSVIADIVEKSSGEVIDIAITAKNQAGDVVLEAKSGLFIRGARKRDGADGVGTERAKDPDDAAWEAAPAAWTRTEHVSADQSKRYAQVSLDQNPIHTDEEIARMAGLPGIILHGLCTMAFVHNACVDEAGGDPMRIKRLAVRFARPVLMGDVLTIQARGPKAGPWLLRVTNQAGVVVVKNGVAELG